MKCVIQRVRSAKVTVLEEIVGEIGVGILVYLGVAEGDTGKDLQLVADKVPNLRIFPDTENKMNCSLKEVNGCILLVSQFTLQADCRKGRRPSFTASGDPKVAEAYYEQLIKLWRETVIEVETGRFQCDMLVESVNWGPATFIFDTCQQ